MCDGSASEVLDMLESYAIRNSEMKIYTKSKFWH